MADLPIAQQVNLRAAEKNIPLSVLVELTYRCNLDCYYCFQRSLSKEKELSRAEWSGILDQLARAGTLYLTFSGGEWLQRDDALDIIADARSRDFAVSIITNGTLVTGAVASRLAALGVMDVGISFLAASADLHDRLSGKKGSFERALSGLRSCVAVGIRTLVKHTVSSESYGEFVKLGRLAEDEGCFFECDANVVTHLPGKPSPFGLTIDQYTRFLREMKVVPMPCSSKADVQSTLHCDAGRSLCGISPSGNVVPCIQLPIVFGNLTKQAFSQIWKSETARRFRTMEKTLDKSCTYCSVSQFCNRCAGIVFYETGGNWQGASSCLCNRAAASAGLAADLSLRSND